MATLTIRNVPDDIVERIKQLANQKGISMEQEMRDLIQSRYGQRQTVINRIRQRWETLPPLSTHELEDWKEQGRSEW